MIDEEIAAAVQGDLNGRPLPRLIQQLFRKRVTGRLVVMDDTGDESVVYLRDGCAVHVERPNDLDRLDRILIESGQVSRAVMTRAEQMVEQTGKKLGQALRELGAIDPQVLFEAVRAQLRRKLMRLFFVRKGSFKVFIEEHTFGQGDEFASVRVDPRPLLFAGIRTAYDDARLLAELQPLAPFSFRLIKLPPGFIDAIGMSSTEPLIRALSTRKVRVEELPQLANRPSEARAMVLTLLYADLLQTERQDQQAGDVLGISPSQTLAPLTRDRVQTRPPTQPVAMGPEGAGGARGVAEDGAPTAALSGSVSTSMAGGTAAGEQLRKKIAEFDGTLETMNLFEVLGLSESASPEQVNAAYMKGVKMFHPDRLSGMGLTDLLGKAEKIVARMGEASQTLSDPQRRMAYVKQLRGTKTEADTAVSILEAEQAFKQGEIALSRGELAGALKLFNEAVARNPAETEYRAYLAWARYAEAPARRQVLSNETLRIVHDAIKERPNFVRGYFWIGELHKNDGDIEQAEKAFRKCLSIDSRFIDAERELRLINMRSKKGGGKGGKGSKAAADDKAAADKESDGKSGSFVSRFLKR